MIITLNVNKNTYTTKRNSLIDQTLDVYCKWTFSTRVFPLMFERYVDIILRSKNW